MKIILLSMICISFLSCKFKKSTPLDIELKRLEKSLDSLELKTISELKKNAEPNFHFGMPLAYRNQYLKKPEDSTLVKYFQSLEISHVDDMSSIVFNSLLKRINKQPIELNNQISNIKKYWTKIKTRELINTLRGIKNFNNHQIGDTVVIRMPINDQVGNSTIRHSFPHENNWIYNDSIDFLIKGVLKEKYKSRDSLLIKCDIKVLSLNRPEINFLMNEIKVGDLIECDMRLDIIENPS